ncbi:hypothetical protein HOL63_00365 [Candidatus Peregrinibacteria bacterium]|jgi:hypothetical protein|nr:hypothetical protein [Candidatus Peregrinibacteria bacterium]MBT5468402.1 hypothetical protein [Candidatus Peregrinibacteria bacterium]MBT7337493.1 hypothetical protein [Candidatus Peregrinibacteria bacterium]
MANPNHSERPITTEGFSNPQQNSVEAERSRFARAFDFVLHGTADLSEEAAKAARPLGKITHHTIAAPIRYAIGAITGKAKR